MRSSPCSTRTTIPWDFYEVAVVEYENELYALLQPAEEIEGIADDEVVIFRIEETENEDDDFFYPVEDEAVQEAVFEEYLRATSSEECRGRRRGLPLVRGLQENKFMAK